MSFDNHKTTLFHDQLLTNAGSERVFLELIKTFPSANVYTLALNRKKLPKGFEGLDIKTPFLFRWIKTHRQFKILFPVLCLFTSFLRFNNCDALIVSSASVAKYVRHVPSKYACFIYTPTRAIWQEYNYFSKKNLFISYVFKIFRNYEKKLLSKIPLVITQSKFSRNQIKECYGIEAHVINSPIDGERLDVFYNTSKLDYYVLISRLEKWKNLNYVIDAFNILEKKLLVIGDGPEKRSLMRKVQKNNNICFLGNIDDDTLTILLSYSRGLIFPTEQEYGLTPLEANAVGTSWIGIDAGASSELTIGRFSKVNNLKLYKNSILYPNANSKSLIEAVYGFEKIHHDPNTWRNDIRKFYGTNFSIKFSELILHYFR